MYVSCMFPGYIYMFNSNPTAFTSQIHIFPDHNGPKGDPMKINLDNFKMQKWVF